MARDPFALPPVSPSRTRSIKAAYQYLCDRDQRRTDARDVIKGLVEHHGAKVMHPSYRTALRCGDIYTEGATSCGLATAKLLLDSFRDKALRYLQEAGEIERRHNSQRQGILFFGEAA